MTLDLDKDTADKGKAFLVSGNDSRLGQVFVNLVDNARSFTAKGGEVRVSLQQRSHWIVVTVDDDGPGIQAEDVSASLNVSIPIVRKGKILVRIRGSVCRFPSRLLKPTAARFRLRTVLVKARLKEKPSFWVPVSPSVFLQLSMLRRKNPSQKRIRLSRLAGNLTRGRGLFRCPCIWIRTATG